MGVKNSFRIARQTGRDHPIRRLPQRRFRLQLLYQNHQNSKNRYNLLKNASLLVSNLKKRIDKKIRKISLRNTEMI